MESAGEIKATEQKLITKLEQIQLQPSASVPYASWPPSLAPTESMSPSIVPTPGPAPLPSPKPSPKPSPFPSLEHSENAGEGGRRRELLQSLSDVPSLEIGFSMELNLNDFAVKYNK